MAEALRLADRLESDFIRSQTMVDAAAELRRLHAENALLGNAADKLRMAWRDEVHCLMQDKRQLIAQRDALLGKLKAAIVRAELRREGAVDVDVIRAAIKAVEEWK